MTTTLAVVLALAVVVGISLGMLGGGGSILAVPALVYVAGQTPKSLTALANLERICKEYLSGQYRIEVIDLTKRPDLAKADQILARPLLARDTEDRHLQLTSGSQALQGREDALEGKIAAGTKEHERVGPGF